MDIMRRAFALFDVAVQATDRSERLGVFDKDGKLVRRSSVFYDVSEEAGP
jgi:hypothetical protein